MPRVHGDDRGRGTQTCLRQVGRLAVVRADGHVLEGRGRLGEGRRVRRRVAEVGRGRVSGRRAERILEIADVLALMRGCDLRELEQLGPELRPLGRLFVEGRLQLLQLEREREDLRVLLGALRRGKPRQSGRERTTRQERAPGQDRAREKPLPRGGSLDRLVPGCACHSSPLSVQTPTRIRSAARFGSVRL